MVSSQRAANCATKATTLVQTEFVLRLVKNTEVLHRFEPETLELLLPVVRPTHMKFKCRIFGWHT